MGIICNTEPGIKTKTAVVSIVSIISNIMLHSKVVSEICKHRLYVSIAPFDLF